MNVSLTPELDQFVAAKVSSGRYTSASEVVREALRLWKSGIRRAIRSSPHSTRRSARDSSP
jgi:putative addiction module CopG family antidote